MEIKIVRHESYQISQIECIRIAITQIEDTFRLKNLFLKDDGCLYGEGISIHSTFEVKNREATPEDLAALAVIDKLQKEKKRLKDLILT